MKITVNPKPPVQPPCSVEICVPKAGTLTLEWAFDPYEIVFEASNLCHTLNIPADCQGLVVQFPGCQAVNVV